MNQQERETKTNSTKETERIRKKKDALSFSNETLFFVHNAKWDCRLPRYLKPWSRISNPQGAWDRPSREHEAQRTDKSEMALSKPHFERRLQLR
mmetsp:Transcript_31452/g.121716  ORF Transcript_31452/g.121716 Transcript_31452/m.121716 type:complete len:94 (-) Transcript_31452:902-1183(-)